MHDGTFGSGESDDGALDSPVKEMFALVQWDPTPGLRPRRPMGDLGQAPYLPAVLLVLWAIIRGLI